MVPYVLLNPLPRSKSGSLYICHGVYNINRDAYTISIRTSTSGVVGTVNIVVAFQKETLKLSPGPGLHVCHGCIEENTQS